MTSLVTGNVFMMNSINGPVSSKSRPNKKPFNTNISVPSSLDVGIKK